jgi:hypothetical protein
MQCLSTSFLAELACGNFADADSAGLTDSKGGIAGSGSGLHATMLLKMRAACRVFLIMAGKCIPSR